MSEETHDPAGHDILQLNAALRNFTNALRDAHLARLDEDTAVAPFVDAILRLRFGELVPPLLALASGELLDGLGECFDRASDVPLELGLGLVEGRVCLATSGLRALTGVAHDASSLVDGRVLPTPDLVAHTVEDPSDTASLGLGGASTVLRAEDAAGGEVRQPPHPHTDGGAA